MACRHNEGGFLRGMTVYVDRHNCEYVTARNGVVDVALQDAAREVGPGLAGSARDNAINRAFMARMDAIMGTPGWVAAPRKNRRGMAT